MTFEFSKYHGAGNDFIIMDNRNGAFPTASTDAVKTLCDRHFGIGADGLILLEPATKPVRSDDEAPDFKMTYFNADGGISSMCGNGARCIVLFANHKQIVGTAGSFEAFDGPHRFEITAPNRVSISMRSIRNVTEAGGLFFVDTGSPHVVIPVKDVNAVDVYKEGRNIRYNEDFKKEGVNVNFVQTEGNRIFIRTYERGVEDETLACGTGCVAGAIWAASNNVKNDAGCSFELKTRGGLVAVSFKHDEGKGYYDVQLEGPAVKVFEGRVTL